MQYAHSFQVGGLTWAGLSHDESFADDKPPILCLHGWLDNAASFLPLAAKLSNEPLLALDFPGHGHSSHRSADAHYYFFDWVHDLVALCRQQQWQQLTVIGHSMGGMVATALAASFPELVAKLVLIDSLGFITTDENEVPAQLRRGIESRLARPAGRRPRYTTLQKAAEARHKQSDFSMQQALILAERGTERDQAGVSWRADMRLRHQSVYRMTMEQATALIRAVECPVLAILAEDGMFKTQPEKLLRNYQSIAVKQVLGGHHCHMTEAALVATLVATWLAEFCVECQTGID
ncbi:alpha/beta hydrolase [Alkalimonas collagenimarina]|uniref:Alpha/beta hydrolase n=1 Tax=Alkalimonas collagenimarina TaxID=400390 RepID=A0ABT9GUD6_9GAMM|nr:alpha/beta hydrolase [Alkalimonas collagenimarina]MDP4534666.1 alpha/beta hydrolase [Alkalimonas collagenimarina]